MGFPTTYAGWISYIRDWLAVDEYSDAQIGQFLDLAQLRLNREMASYGMEAVTTITVVDDDPINILSEIPDFNKIRLVSPVGQGPFNVASINEMESYRQGGQVPATNSKGFYCIDAGLLYLYPVPSAGTDIKIFYYKEIPSISKTPVVNSNVFTLKYPDSLLYAAVLEAAPYVTDFDSISVWQQKYDTAIAIANDLSTDIKMGSTPLVREIARIG